MMGTCFMKILVRKGSMSCSALEANIQCLAEVVNYALKSSEMCASKLAHYIPRLHLKRKMVIVSAEFGGYQNHDMLLCK